MSVVKQESNVPLYDCREYCPLTQILHLTHDYVKNLVGIPPEDQVEQEVLTFVETVFKSLACINGSFLLNDEKHYYCSSRHHGVNLQEAEATFSLIGKIENSSIKDLVSSFCLFLLLLTITITLKETEFVCVG